MTPSPLKQPMNDKEIENIRLGHYLGRKDMLASILADTKDKIKLPEQAKFYEFLFGEKHFSNDWHTKE